MEPGQSTPEQLANRHATQPEKGHERALSHLTEMSVGSKLEQESVNQSSSSDTAVAAQAATPLAPALPLPAPLASITVSDDNANPLVAADEDLIEKEWVDKVKKVILDTKDDPYRREQEVKKVQIDYVKKRYGRDLGASGD